MSDEQPSRQAAVQAEVDMRLRDEWRDYYESQGREAIRDGRELECSTKPIVDIVCRMICDPSWSYTSILDVGCGANTSYARHLDSRCAAVVGIDFSFPFLSMARRHGRTRIVQGDATELPFCDESFDAVLCSETLEHIPDDRGAMLEIQRVLRPRGLLFLTVPNYWSAARVLAAIRRAPGNRDLQVGHLREYSRVRVDALLGTGFVVRARYPVPFLWRGALGGPIDALIRAGILPRLSMSIALVAERAGA